ncbi:hypothetical protein GGTG_02708 [Gaeumannomyces tritici R3-111a-1]|uniref:Uncharacterized protein n=1 Tax=Gaeumannomyces tritici (strain R3-111a-1) TaxID=644352 RepID=J3NN50_GAET3|nr:hypothetical protein GGTG_02708 [Gaeumannomyces tritici R3-111a-1]EJT77602.1 hypothetical protein GGTG_02708 [Gaeumannomyces tritici R3-111a-1]
MAQGTVKISTKAATAKPLKKGARVTKPKKAKPTKADKLVKKYTSGLVNQTEKLLGERAGHLELIGKGRKGKTADAGGKKQTGGSKKFG